MNYIIKYNKVPHKNKYNVILSNGAKFDFYISGRYVYFLWFNDVCNDYLFTRFGINKSELYFKVFNRPYSRLGGIWPYCKTGKECIILLKALIKETQIKYYEDTEI